MSFLPLQRGIYFKTSNDNCWLDYHDNWGDINAGLYRDFSIYHFPYDERAEILLLQLQEAILRQSNSHAQLAPCRLA